MNGSATRVPLPNRALCGLASLLYRMCGWRVEGRLPDLPKYVIITTHTSNWDYFVGLVAMAILSRGFFGLRFLWIGKRELFHGPQGAILRRTGGVPVDRGASRNAVEQCIQAFRSQERLVMALTPEGTRRKTTHWKTGFYHIAHGAQVPIVCGFLDYERRAAGMGPVLAPSGDIEADMEAIREFYRPIAARYPDQVGDIRVLPGSNP